MSVMEASELAKIVEKCNLPATKAADLVEAFGTTFVQVRDVAAVAESIVVTDATQVTEMKAARENRLKLRALRVGADKIRKDLKEASLREGQGIQNVYNMIAGICEPLETRLEHAEKFAERAEADRKAKLKAARSEALAAFVPDVSIYPLGEMTDAAWSQLLDGSRAAHEARIAAERKAEEDRLAAIEAKRVEDARIRAENERLAAEAKAERERAAAIAEAARVEREKAEAAARKAKAESDALIAKERRDREEAEAKAMAEQAEAARKAKAAADAALAKERKSREEAEAAARAERDAAAAKAKAEAEAKAKAEAAPDVDKLLALADAFAAVRFPDVASGAASSVLEAVSGMQVRLCEYIRTRAKSI